MKKIVQFGSYFYTGLLVCLIIIFLFIKFAGMTSLGPWQTKVVLTDSMNESYPAGSLLFVKKEPVGEISKGDVISFSESGEVVSHRVIQINKDASGLVFQTKGDSNIQQDAFKVRENQIQGVVKTGIPKVGEYLMRLQTFRGILAFCMFIADLFLLELFLKILWS